MSTTLSPVAFHGDTIFCTTYQNQPYTAMKPIIENMGLAWQPQARKLTACKERWGITIMVIPTSSGNQETLCMPVRKLPAFLNTINPKKVRPELRERIELYQAESDDVLWEYWTKQQALPPLSTVESRRTLNTLVRQWASLSGLSYPDCWAEVHVAFDIETVADLPAALVKEAEVWVQAKIDALSIPVSVSVQKDFPAELVEYDGKNFWKDLEDLIKRIGAINTALAMNVRTGCLMRHEFYADTINNQVGIAQGALVLARGALGDALRLKTAVNVWK